MIKKFKLSKPSKIVCNSIGFPPRKSCPGYADRIKKHGSKSTCWSCYGQGGTCKWEHCTDLLESNWQLYVNCKTQEEMNALVLNSIPLGGKRPYFRFQWNGDTPSLRFAKAVVNAAKKLPGINFMIPTKTNFYDKLEIPSNLKVRPSSPVLNEPVGINGMAVYTKDVELPKGHFICAGQCEECGWFCWHSDRPVVLRWHGCIITQQKMRKEGFNV